jgi:hypothetical protein
MTSASYDGNLTSAEIELRAGTDLLSVSKRLGIGDRRQHADALREVLTADGLALRVLAGLDAMVVREGRSENVDRIRFVFIAITDFLSLDACPVALIQDFGFAIPAAFHIAKGSLARAAMIAPAGIPPELFASFWTTTVGDFHIPTTQIELVRQELEKKLRETEDRATVSELIAIQRGLSGSLDRQRTAIQNVRKRLRGQLWFSDRSVYTAFVKHCLVPRILFSEIDSIFCAHFVFTICHFSDCEFEYLNEEVVRCLHFLVFSATAEESRGIGIFLAKLLKFNEARAEENRLHAEITRKMLLLLGRREEFALWNALTVLDKMVKYYPKKDEHVGVIDTKLEEIAPQDGGSIGTKVKRYKANRKLAIARRKQTETAEPSASVSRAMSTENLHSPQDAEGRSPTVPRSQSRPMPQYQMPYDRSYDDRTSWKYTYQAYQAYQYPTQAQLYDITRQGRRPQ